MKKNKLLLYGIFALALSFLLLIPMQGNIFSVAAEEEPIIYIGEITGNNSSNKDKKSISTRSADNYNLVCRNYETNNTEFIYYTNSFANTRSAGEKYTDDTAIRETYGYNSESPDNMATRGIIGSSEIKPVDNTETYPYKMVCKVSAFFRNCYVPKYGKTVSLVSSGTAFFEGPSLLATAGHVLFGDPTSGDYDDGIDNPRFPDEVYIEPATYEDSTSKTKVYPYGRIRVSKSYIQKEYYLNRDANFDWGGVLIESDIGYTTGWFGKSCNNTLADYDIKIIGYPGDLPYNMYYSEGKIVSTDSYRYAHNSSTSGGMSGSPILIEKNGSIYVVGIHTSYKGSLNYGVKINSFIFDFLNSLLPTDGVEFKNFYYKGAEYHRYNCVVQSIICPENNTEIQLSKNGNNTDKTISSLTVEYYATPSDSSKIILPYSYYRLYNKKEGTYTSYKYLMSRYSDYDVSATYATKAKSDINSNIYTTYDQSGNMWNHGGTSSKKIRGTIVYDGIAENIDVDIPWLGYKTSESVTIKGVTFTLRCGPNKVSIKASSSVLCNGNTTFFAFGVA